MAKLSIELEDLPDGETHVIINADDLRTASTRNTNTTVQNAAIIILSMLKDVGICADRIPDLTRNDAEESKNE